MNVPAALPQLPQPAFQERAFGPVLGAGQRRFVGAHRLGVAAETAQQVGADGVAQVVGVEVEGLDEGQCRFGAVGLGHGDRAVQGHHGVGASTRCWS